MRLAGPERRPLSWLGGALGGAIGSPRGFLAPNDATPGGTRDRVNGSTFHVQWEPVVSRRGHGEGSVYKETRTRQTKDGPVVVTLWVATVGDERDPVTGSRRRVKVRAKTKAAAMEKVRAHQQRLDAGVREEPKLTVGQFMTDWLAVVVTARVAHSTYLNYRNAVNIHIVPALGRHKLRDLKPEHVDRFLKAKADAGVAKRYVSRMRCILTDALDHAQRRQLISRNAGRLSIMPACTPIEEPRALTAEEVDAFVAEAMSVDHDGALRHRL